MAVSGAGLLSIPLTWTAVGNNGLIGQAASYDVRYSTFPIITEADWAGASQAVGEPSPQSFDATENFTVIGLDHSTSYYFGLKVSDQAANESGLSNIAQASTGAATTVFEDDMEGGIGGWTAVGSPGLWHISERKSTSPNSAWYYGMELLGSYNTGAANDGTLTSQAIDLTLAPDATLYFSEWSQVEDLAGFDRTRVQISTDGSSWTTVFETHDTSGAWGARTVDLTSYVGGNIYLRFFFETRDAVLNDYEGWYVDDVLILTTGANDPPVADPGSAYIGTEDVLLAFDGSGSSDPDDDSLTYDWDFGDGSPHSTGVSPSHTYLAGGIYNVTLVVNDGTSNSAPSITTAGIADVNDAPTADPGGPPPGGPYNGVVGVAVVFDGSGSSDPDGDALTYSWTFSDVSTATGETPSHTFSDAGNYAVTLVVNDGTVNSDPVGTTVEITAANQAPVAVDDGYSVDEDSGLSLAALVNVLDNDSDDDGDPLTAILVGDVGNGALTLIANGSFTYTPNANFSGDDSFTYVANDGTVDSSPATVTITVNPASMHVHDLSAVSTNQPKGAWSSLVTISIRDSSNPHTLVAGVIVAGHFLQNGSSSGILNCTTDGNGVCEIDSGPFSNKSGKGKTFEVQDVYYAVPLPVGALTYDSAANHDPDPDSDGTTISLSK